MNGDKETQTGLLIQSVSDCEEEFKRKRLLARVVFSSEAVFYHCSGAERKAAFITVPERRDGDTERLSVLSGLQNTHTNILCLR